jgi:hypothetical protein|tara:strand:+ start:91 stop:342 length:252 start_codon:yes stop_codon:yes gene_type:complete
MTSEDKMLVKTENRVELSEEQTELWKAIFGERQKVQEQAQALDGRIQSMMVAAGWSGNDIVDGNLLDEKPFFILKPSEAKPTE